MQITVFGASGKIGTLVVEELLRDGHKVIAFVHHRNLFSPSGGLVVIQGDIYEPEDVKKALKGSDAVVSCLGSWGTPKKNVLTSAMEVIIPAMEANEIRRMVTLTGSGAKAPDESESAMHSIVMRLMKPFPAGRVFKDGEDHMATLAASSVAWTTLRSPVMNNLKPFTYALSMRPLGPLATIARQAVAHALVEQLSDTTFIGQAPLLHRK